MNCVVNQMKSVVVALRVLLRGLFAVEVITVIMEIPAVPAAGRVLFRGLFVVELVLVSPDRAAVLTVLVVVRGPCAVTRVLAAVRLG